MLDRLEFLFSEAFLSLRRNLWMTFAAVTTSAMALLLLGGLGLAYMRITEYAASLPGKLDVRVFMEWELDRDRALQIGDEIAALPEVSKVEFVPREEGWAEYQEQFPDITHDLANPLPDSFNVRLHEVGDADAVASKVLAIEGVDEDGVEYLSDVHKLLDEAIRLTKLLGVGLGGMMALTSGVLIYNAIRMAILARRREIRIMQLVGASRATVWTPLLIEGVIQGILGGAIAASVLWIAYGFTRALIASVSTLGDTSRFPILLAFTVLVIAGALYGLICSAIAVREPRRIV